VNLLTNSHKYTPQGGHVTIEVARDGRFAEVRVRDDGMGLSPQLVPRVFDVFVQGERTLDRAEGGLGIGLTLVRRLVELHGGTVSATSPGPGLGSEFLVRLPVLEETAAPTPPPGMASPASAGRRVVVVDDNRDSADSLALLLSLWGHETRVAGDGPSALAAVAEFVPDLVLMDIGLPGMNGYAVAEELRGTPAKLVAMTGYGRPEDVERARQAGFAEHLVKPVDPERLKGILAGLAPRKD